MLSGSSLESFSSGENSRFEPNLKHFGCAILNFKNCSVLIIFKIFYLDVQDQDSDQECIMKYMFAIIK